MRWQTCIFPRELTLEGVAPPREKWNDLAYKKWPEQENEKLERDILKSNKILNVLYKCTKM